jgi:hypothetical protein
MKITIAIFSVIGLAALSACSSKTDANEKNFREVLNKHVPQRCLFKHRSWPVQPEPSQMNSELPPEDVKQMEALVSVGLVKVEEFEAEEFRIYGKRPIVKFKRYVLTPAAKPFEDSKEVSSNNSDNTTKKITTLCYAISSVDKIVKWEGPIKYGDYQEVRVFYTFTLDDIAEWAKNSQVQAAFPFVKFYVNGVGIKEVSSDLKLTSIGWEILKRQ